MQFEPAFLDRVANAGAEFRARCLAAVLRQERRVDLLDVNAPVDRLDAGGELEELARGDLRICEGASLDVLHALAPASLSRSMRASSLALFPASLGVSRSGRSRRPAGRPSRRSAGRPRSGPHSCRRRRERLRGV